MCDWRTDLPTAVAVLIRLCWPGGEEKSGLQGGNVISEAFIHAQDVASGVQALRAWVDARMLEAAVKVDYLEDPGAHHPIA